MRPAALDDARLTRLAREHGTPLWVYDGATIEARVASLARGASGAGFDVVRYAQKANSNLAVLALVRRAGARVDAVSAGEIARALAVGYAPSEIAFTADLFDAAALEWIARHDVPVNLGSPDMVDQYAALRPGRGVTLRVNPGFGHGHARQVNTGGETSKHGIWHEDLSRVVARARALGLRVDGLHVHIGSGSDFEHLARVAAALERLARVVGPELATISAGGGLPTPYRDDDPVFDVARYRDTWLASRERIARELGRAITLEVEPGRYLVAESGVLVTAVRGTKRSGSFEYVLVDAGFHNLLRPALYGAHHRITAIGAPAHAPLRPCVVAGPLCESADVFTQGPGGVPEPCPLPESPIGSLLCIHDAGAYGASMSSNYNSQPFAAEVLLDRGVERLVRRRQTIDELLDAERTS